MTNDKEGSSMLKAIIIIATHKSYWMPDDPIYLPLHVGAANGNRLPFAGDDTGKNISAKNPNYCELTGLYWAWKNLPADYLGLAHYRRHFANGRRFGDKKKRIISGPELEKALSKAQVLLPKPRHYRIETGYSQYAHAHHAIDLDTMRTIIGERCPEYLPAFDRVMKQTHGHRFNMFVMARPLLDAYCAWLFDLLFALERRLDISAYSPYDARVFGFVGERLLDVWLITNRVPYRELPYVYMESQNWLIKGWNFLRRKLTAGRKEEQ